MNDAEWYTLSLGISREDIEKEGLPFKKYTT